MMIFSEENNVPYVTKKLCKIRSHTVCDIRQNSHFYQNESFNFINMSLNPLLIFCENIFS